MSSKWFGAVEGLLIVAAVIAFYFWQMRSLNRDIEARKEREARERSAPDAGHSERQHELDEP